MSIGVLWLSQKGLTPSDQAIRWMGPGHPDPDIRRGPGLKKKRNFFGPSGLSFV